jgi:hypothetical protein
MENTENFGNIDHSLGIFFHVLPYVTIYLRHFQLCVTVTRNSFDSKDV